MRRRSVDRKHLMGFQSETSVFKFLGRSVDRGLESYSDIEKAFDETDGCGSCVCL